MLHYWLIVSLSWIGSARLQHISTAYEEQNDPAANSALNTLDTVLNFPPHKSNYFSTSQNLEGRDREQSMLDMLFPDAIQLESPRVRRTPELAEGDATSSRFKHFAAEDGPPFILNENRLAALPLILEGEQKEGLGVDTLRSQKAKKNFSPWGGKRDVNNMWSWKRASSIREPSMPKRVRFSPWGGKRSTQVIFKPGSKAAKIIFSKAFPELTRIVSSYSQNGINVAGFQLIPVNNKRSPIRILALSSKLQGTDALPFKAYLESTKMFKTGHPYSDVNLKREDKRKVKFSAWGGKRAPPIIGPIWSPSTQSIQDHTLDTILLIRKDDAAEIEKTTKAY
ncbi:hypothetical protein NE865_03127 [Phthorimaea operculella]|nr:hypothetical protein NE865_03127 [Phthorimaea operculella]